MNRARLRTIVIAAGLTPLLGTAAFASGGETLIPDTSSRCQRPAAGSVVRQPPELFSHGGVLNVSLDYFTSLDDANRTLFCFKTADGTDSPTLHVSPGDTLNITLTNRVPALPAGAPTATMSSAADLCGSATMTGTSMNIHFHGTNTRPVCHADEAIHTLVNSGQTFKYTLTFPRDESPGLYWYHPHVHGMAEAAVMGGATGAIIVDGIESLQPAVAKLPTRVLMIRDQPVAGNPEPGGAVPAWDITLNQVPVAYPALRPAVIETRAGRKEFWRVANTSADTVADLRLIYDGVTQPLDVVALDGVATGSQDGTRRGTVVTKGGLLLPPGGRGEFIITAPPASVRNAILQTAAVYTGPDGDNITTRTLAVLRSRTPTSAAAQVTDADTTDAQTVDIPAMPDASGMPAKQRYEGLDTAPIKTVRNLYFSEVMADPSNPASDTNFFMTVDGAKPTLFEAFNPPAIVTTQGSVEQWTIENRTGEVHDFHMHQIHYQLRERNHVPVAAADRQFLDTVQIPFWTGKGPYPSVTVAMDFRGNIIGDFVYHCHILEHEDKGMMAIIRVLPRPGS